MPIKLPVKTFRFAEGSFCSPIEYVELAGINVPIEMLKGFRIGALDMVDGLRPAKRGHDDAVFAPYDQYRDVETMRDNHGVKDPQIWVGQMNTRPAPLIQREELAANCYMGRGAIALAALHDLLAVNDIKVYCQRSEAGWHYGHGRKHDETTPPADFCAFIAPGPDGDKIRKVSAAIPELVKELRNLQSHTIELDRGTGKRSGATWAEGSGRDDKSIAH